jgi:hypothetical protein
MTTVTRLTIALLSVGLLSSPSVSTAQSLSDDPVTIAPLPPALRLPLVVDTPVVQRPRAIEYSDAYYTRLTIHRYGSYVMIPLFVAEYSLGQNLMNDASPASWMKPSHVAVASGIGVLFGVNTVTGVWNLWESRHDPAGRTRRIVHSVMMIASDAGFLAAAAVAPGGNGQFSTRSHDQRVHRNVAIGSFALSTVGGAMMWFWKQ